MFFSVHAANDALLDATSRCRERPLEVANHYYAAGPEFFQRTQRKCCSFQIGFERTGGRSKQRIAATVAISTAAVLFRLFRNGKKFVRSRSGPRIP